jgi:hypothetical protein
LLGLGGAVVAGAGLVVWLGAEGAEHPPEPAPPSVLGPRSSSGGHFSATLEPVRKPVEVGVTGSWLVTVRHRAGKAAKGCSIGVDGWMPAHGHGLPTAPRVTREVEQGVYLVEGMRLSMPGAWELRLAIANCGEPDTATFPLLL